LNRKPDFFIVGAAKSGTTSLYNYITQHPNIFMPVEKEPFFFGDWRPSASREDLERYLRLFEDVPTDTLVGEASSTYLYLESAAREIKHFQPYAKIIIVLRNPVDRAYSQYWHHVRQELVSSSFEEELEEEEKRLQEGWRGFYPGEEPPSYYIKSGHYAEQVARFLKVFGSDSVRIYLFEDLVTDAEGVCRDVFSFLGVNPDQPVDVRRIYNVSGPVRNALLGRLITRRLRIKEVIKRVVPISWLRLVREWVLQRNVARVPEMRPETRRRLQELFREDVVYIQELTGRDLSHWLGGTRAEPQRGSSKGPPG
jgi:hypothetical protein